jgi:HEAT repeat protein
MDSEQIQTLFARTLLGDYESEEAWAAVSALRMDGSRAVFERAAEWCHANDPLKRARATAVLCQLRRARLPDTPDGPEEWMFRDESYELITKMLENEQDPVVFDSAISALGHLANPKAIPLILRYQDHPNQDVRLAVAFALGCFPNDPPSICALMTLTMDSSSDVRDWAVFGLGVQGDADSPEIRETLLRCLNDADENVREEAAVGLGKRHDQRLIPSLWTMLDNSEFGGRVSEAAVALLALDQVPSEWAAPDYRAALKLKFNLKE